MKFRIREMISGDGESRYEIDRWEGNIFNLNWNWRPVTLQACCSVPASWLNIESARAWIHDQGPKRIRVVEEIEV